MELKQRKQIRLVNYDYSQNNAYYITICTYNRVHLFGEIVGATLRGRSNSPNRMIEKWLFELENKYDNLKIDKYIIMPDHIHFIDWFKTMTTNEYIRGGKIGLFSAFDRHIWQRSYYEHIIRNDDDYKEICQYIEDNPIKYDKD